MAVDPEEKQAAIDHLTYKAFFEPMDYIKLDTNTLEDDAIQELFWEAQSTLEGISEDVLNGYAALGLFVTLALKLGRKKEHAYSASTPRQKKRIAIELLLDEDVSQSFLERLAELNLIKPDAYKDGVVESQRIIEDNWQFAKVKGSTRYGQQRSVESRKSHG